MKSVFFQLLATRAASGSNPSPPGPTWAEITPLRTPNQQGAGGGGSLGVLRHEKCDFEDSIGVESVHFQICVH